MATDPTTLGGAVAVITALLTAVVFLYRELAVGSARDRKRIAELEAEVREERRARDQLGNEYVERWQEAQKVQSEQTSRLMALAEYLRPGRRP